MILENQTLSYGNKAVLKDISLHFKRGEKVALLGRSGSGKSTLLKHLFGLNEKNSTYIPQELGLVQSLSVYHNIYISQLENHSFFYNLKNLFFPYQAEIQKVAPLLKKLHMEEVLLKPCAELSGGQMQRTAIARAILGKKDTLLADEPISALDAFLTQEVMKLLCENFETMVCTLHNVEIALQYFDRVIGIKEGTIFLDKKPYELQESEIEQLYDACTL